MQKARRTRADGGAWVYVITHTESLRHYVGKSRDPSERWRQHLRGTSTRRSYIQRAIRHHGADAFVMQPLEWHATDDEAYAAEQFWIEYLRSNVEAYGFNLSAGGEGNPKFDVTAATRAKMAESAKRRWSRPGERERNAEQAIRVHTGKKRSPEACKRISESTRGRHLTEEHKAVLRQSTKGKPRPYIRELFRGVPKSPEHIAKIAAFHTGRKRSEETKAKLRAAWVKRRERERQRKDDA